MLNKIMARGRHSLVLEVEMDGFSVLHRQFSWCRKCNTECYTKTSPIRKCCTILKCYTKLTSRIRLK